MSFEENIDDVNLRVQKQNIMKKLKLSLLLLSSIAFITYSCSEGTKKDPKPVDVQDLTKDQPEVHGKEMKESDITLSNPLNGQWVADGKSIYELKCASCHKLTGEKLVGPGWKKDRLCFHQW